MTHLRLPALVLTLVGLTLGSFACGKDPGGAADAGGGSDGGIDAALDGGAVEPALAILSPEDGAELTLSEAAEGVTFRVQLQGIEVLTLRDDETTLHVDSSVSEGTYPVALVFSEEGTHQIIAEGWNDGEVVVSDVVRVIVGAGGPIDLDPGTGTCHERLDAIGVDWEVAGASAGVDDPVRVGPSYNGIDFRYIANDAPSALYVDCQLALALNKLTLLLHEYGVVEVGHQGVYNYRCIGGGNPDTDGCRPSQHAYATAIDLNRFLLEDGSLYRVDTDWTIEADDVETCPGELATEGDRVLHEIACRLYSERIFAIILTPNYNDAHRDHFHVDLTEGSHYLGVSITGVDPDVVGLGH